MRSHLLTGKVRHRRTRPFTYQLEHDVFYFALDLSESDEIAARSRLVRRNRRGIVELRDADHLPEPARDLDADVRGHLRSEGHDPAGWRITLVTNFRILGHVFNPASFYLCRDAAGTLAVVIVEVHNTFGERHLYTLQPGTVPEVDPAGRPFSAAMPKAFFVSPFISVDGRYAVHVRDEDAGLRISIVLRQEGEVRLSTSLVLERRAFTDRNLLRLLIRHPLMTHRTIGLIHWHAVRLWLKGATFYRHGVWREAQRPPIDGGHGRPARAPGR
ncbi:MAG TPA: DUF1365 domain-containing protein [Candidatus Limnocylindria bacterium]|nr:DUF1365 domain-containing protein [Candidatus Limnocylindria bacterium]